MTNRKLKLGYTDLPMDLLVESVFPKKKSVISFGISCYLGNRAHWKNSKISILSNYSITQILFKSLVLEASQQLLKIVFY